MKVKVTNTSIFILLVALAYGGVILPGRKGLHCHVMPCKARKHGMQSKAVKHGKPPPFVSALT